MEMFKNWIMKEKANWTQNGLLVIIITMMGWFMADFAGWKHDISDEMKGSQIERNENEKHNLLKNQKQDIEIIKNRNKIFQLEKESKLLTERLNKGGL